MITVLIGTILKKNMIYIIPVNREMPYTTGTFIRLSALTPRGVGRGGRIRPMKAAVVRVLTAIHRPINHPWPSISPCIVSAGQDARGLAAEGLHVSSSG